jgi:hypothetical protein
MKKMKTLAGIPIISETTFKRRAKAIKPLKITMHFPLDGSCREGDLDKCQAHCGACVEAGGFENIPQLVTYSV